MHKAATVQICKAGGQIVGVGFAVTQRHILTCAHVVNAALNQKKENQTQPSEEVTIKFPFLNEASTTAKIVYWKPPQSALIESAPEDIAGLELTAPIPNSKPVHIGDFREAGSKFTAFGYPADRPKDGGVWADGEIKDYISPGWVQIEGTDSQGRRVEQGFSGTAVWNQAKSTVLGMVVAEYTEDETVKVAYMIPSEILKVAIAYLKLREILVPSNGDSPTPEIRKIYQKAFKACCPDGWLEREGCPKALDEVLRQLQDMFPRKEINIGDDSFGRLPEFTARLIVDSERKLSEQQYEKLNQWANDNELENFVELREWVKEQQAQVAQVAQESKTSDPYLIFEVSSSQKIPGNYNTRAFFIPNLKELDLEHYKGFEQVFASKADTKQEREEIDTNLPPCLLNELCNHLKAYLNVCLDKPDLEVEPTIAVFLPKELIHLDVNRWQLDDGFGDKHTLGIRFKLLIRLQNRITEYRKQDKSRWNNHWKRLQQTLEEEACNRLAKVKTGASLDLLTAYLNENHPHEFKVGFILDEVLQESTNNGFFNKLLSTAAPIAIWLRAVPKTIENDAVESISNCLNKLLSDPLHGIPGSVHQERLQAVKQADEHHVGYNISLLWEDPQLMPPKEFSYRTQ